MTALLGRLFLLRKDLVVLWRAFWHPLTPLWLKAAMLALVAYVVSPIDIVPDFLMLFGILDDVLIVTFASRWIVSKLPDAVYHDVMATP